MNHFKILAFFSQKNWPWLLSIIFILILLSLNNLLWKEHTINSETDILFKIRGGRKISPEILFINLAEEDIQKLGGWPITRDYYGYLTHILTEKGARVIGFDLLFDRRDQTYPEFDSMLARFIKASGSVCLPLVFSNIIEIQEKINNKLPAKTGKGENPILPVKIFRKSAAALGFSNLGNQAVIRKIPLAVSSGDSVLFSLGVQLAHQYLNPAVPIKINSRQLILQDSDNREIIIPLDYRARVRLNYFGATDNITCMGFVNFLKIQEESPDSLNLRGKIVLIAPTSASLPVIKSTPLSELFPASLIHATLTENIIFQNYIRKIPFWIDVLLIIVFITIISLVCQIKNTRLSLTITTGVIVLYLLLAVGIFKYKNTALPIFHPFAAVLITSLYWIWQKKWRQNRNLSLHSDVLNRHLQEKQKQLLEAQEKLKQLQAKLDKEIKEKKILSQKSRELAQQKQKAVIALEKQVEDLEQYSHSHSYPTTQKFKEIIHSGESKMVETLTTMEKLSSEDIPVLIMGETGTGKELIANNIHKSSSRGRHPFIAVNCGALPENLLESELFGHEKGSFTGAVSRRRGRFEMADKGTIFLDEITETSPAFQSRLLRVLQEKNFQRVGGEKTIHIDVRVIAASSKNIKSQIENNEFREDLFYRLNGFMLTIPPLRNRGEDIPLLAEHFLKKYNYSSIKAFSEQAMKILTHYHWPGNVRELENIIRRAAILAKSEGRSLIQKKDLPEDILKQKEIDSYQFKYVSLEEQILHLLRSMEFSHSSISRTAEMLNNKDRGTITEYFRGICFKTIVDNNYNLNRAAKKIAQCDNKIVVQRVKSKIKKYLKNLQPFLDENKNIDSTSVSYMTQGLPQKYHTYFLKIINNYNKILI